jgi:two-component system response regulator YesN
MMIILIADDENLVRIGLKQMIKEIHLKDTIILEAKNGNEMLSICQDYIPDLAFVDIKMPIVNGLEAITQLQDVCKDTYWVLLTGFSDFSYAVEAIKLGVKDYLLKPIEFSCIVTIVQKVEKNIAKRKTELNSSFELNIIFQFNTLNLGVNVDRLWLTERQQYIAYLVIEDISNSSHNTSVLYKSFVPTTRKMLNKLQNDQLHFAIFCLPSGTLCIVLRSNINELTNLNNLMLEEAKQNSSTSNIITLFSCETKKDIFQLSDKLKVLENDFSLRISTGLGKLYHFDEINRIKNEPHLEEYTYFLYQLTEAFEECNEIQYNLYVDKIKNYSKGPALYKKFQQNILKYLYFNLDLERMPSSTSLTSYDAFCNLLKNKASSMYQKIKPCQNDLVSKMKEYIQANYANDVSIISLAQAFNLAPTYLSKIFHDRAKIKLIDYIIDVRIKNAKKIITENPGILIKDVALLVGYNSCRHFSSLFQKNVGMYPSSFQRSLLS